jgi:internalin A
MGKSTYALTLCMASLFLLISQAILAAEVVVFPDPGLDAAIRQAINKPAGDILDTDLVGVGFTSLYASWGPISDLTGLEHCTDLTRLELRGIHITDLTPLAGLTSLTYLDLQASQIADLAPLAGLTSLTYLDLQASQIADLAPLAGLTSLTYLDLRYSQIADLAPLAGLTSLTYLDLGGNQIADVAPLAGLTSLTFLDLWKNFQIADVAPLAGLTSLTTLDLSRNQIADLAPLAGLTNLTELYLYRNQIADLAPLAGLTNLTGLGLGANQIADLAPLSGLTSLEWLNFCENQIADLAPLAGLTSLTSIVLDTNQIADLAPLAGLTNLTELCLYQNQIADLAPLAGLTSLTTLYLHGNQIADLAPLAGLTSLWELDLSGNQIADLAPLAGLTSLLELDLSENQIANVAPLAGLVNLSFLYLDSNLITDIPGLVANSGLGAGDEVWLQQNPLSENALCEQIPQFQWRGVTVYYDGTCGSEGEGEGEACTLFETLRTQGNIVAAELGPVLRMQEEYRTNYGTWNIEGIEVPPPAPFGDGIQDLWQLAMFADSYCNPNRWLHNEAVAAYGTNLAAVTSELPDRSGIWEWIAASVSLSSRMRDTVCALFALNPENYEPVTLPGKGVNEPFSAEGDCDGDGTSNIEEYEYIVVCGGDIESFVIAASENSPFWEENPALPVAGIIGLLVLCAGIAIVTVRLGRKSVR